MDLSTDILQPIPFEEWPILQNGLKNHWPTYAHYYYWIENAIKWKNQEPEIALQIYCPNGNYTDTCFVGIASYAIHSIVTFAYKPSRNRLLEAILQTNRIDWRKRGVITLSSVHEHMWPTVYSIVEALKQKEGIEIMDDVPGHYYFKSADACLNTEVKIPDDCYLADLNSSHVPLIHTVWPHASKKYPEYTTKFLDTIIRLNKGMGLFLRRNNELVSWALHHDWHGLGMVQTIDGYKRKGYCKIVSSALAKELGGKGISTVLFIVERNIPSERMFQSLCWEPINKITFIGLKSRVDIDD